MQTQFKSGQTRNLMLKTLTAAVMGAGVLSLSSVNAHAMAKPNKPMQAVLDQLTALHGKPIEKLTPAVARKQPLPVDAVIALLKKMGKSTAPEPVGSVTDTSAAGVRVRVYKPKGSGPFPVVVYAHGGGFLIASVQDYDSSCRALANAANAMIVSVAYDYAPEYKLPHQPMQMYAVTQWLFKNAEKWGGDKNRIAVAGESAGGAAATATCLIAKKMKTKMPIYQLLVYPFVDASRKALNAPSMIENKNAKPLSRALVAWFDKYALPSLKAGDSPKYSPLYANLKGLPPATVILAEIDPLRSQGMAYATKLQRAGVPVRWHLYRGVTHEFFGMGAVVPQAKEAVAFGAQGLKMAFRK